MLPQPQAKVTTQPSPVGPDPGSLRHMPSLAAGEMHHQCEGVIHWSTGARWCPVVPQLGIGKSLVAKNPPCYSPTLATDFLNFQTGDDRFT